MTRPRVGDVHFHPADRTHRATGLLGWLSADIDSVRVDAITLRRTREGKLTLGFPEHTARDGKRFPTVRPRGHWERGEIERGLIEAVRRQGYVA